MLRTRHATSFIMTLLVGLASSAIAGPPHAMPDGKTPDDRRLGKLRSTDQSTFPMRPVAGADKWPARRDEIRTRILVAAGLHPMPKRSPLNPRIHGKVERDDYTIERVVFESFPGHYVTGSLYRPKGPVKGKRPAVLSPYGHWNKGRFHDHGEELVRKEIASGAERFKVGGRHVIQARCVQLARMGCVVLVYDMEGYADSVQLDHRAGPRSNSDGQNGFLLHSPRAELRGYTPFGLQTWNSIRALDFIASLDDVDPKRIAVTGGSGGGTQSMILGAIDRRIAASMPAVMVSSGAQGGCTCENSQYLRIGQGNVDIAAATAPRPLGIICANDWTKALKSSGHAELKALYKMLDHSKHYEAHFHFEFGHNYNSVNRQHMYHFMNRHLKLGLSDPIVERDYVPLDMATEATVWTDKQRKPDGEHVGDPHERKVTAEWTKATEAVLKGMHEKDRLRVTAEGLAVMVGRSLDDVGPVKWKQVAKVDAADHLMTVGTLTAAKHGEQLPTLLIYPRKNWNRQVVVWLADVGKDAVLDIDGKPTAAVGALLDKGFGVASIDMFGQGEFLKSSDGKAIESVQIIHRGKGARLSQRAACYHFGYNPPLAVQRVHDVMSLVEFLRREDGDRKAARIHLVAIGKQAGPVGLVSRSVLGDRIDKAAIDAQGFNFGSVDRFDHPMFLPGILRYGGIKALWALNRPLGAAKISCADAVPNALEGWQESGVRDLLPVFRVSAAGRLSFPYSWSQWSKLGRKDFDRWRTESRKRVQSRFLAAPSAAPFKPVVIASRKCNGYTSQKIAFNLTGDSRVLAYLLVPDGEGPHPAVLLLHDHGAEFRIGKEKSVEPWEVPAEKAALARKWADKVYGGRFIGDQLAARGYVVLVYDALNWSDRGGAGFDGQQALASNLLHLGMSFAGLIAHEDLRGAEFLASRGEVDRRRIAAMGHSMGSFRTWQVAAMSDHIAAGVCCCWMATVKGMMVPGNNQTKGQSSFTMTHPGLFNDLDYPDVASLACPKPMLFFAGGQDTLFPVPSVKDAFAKMHRVWESQNAGDKLTTKLLPVRHTFNATMQDQAFDWLDRHLNHQRRNHKAANKANDEN
jgi:cephalosporin-C deacetylase-like acetyl esterase